MIVDRLVRAGGRVGWCFRTTRTPSGLATRREVWPAAQGRELAPPAGGATLTDRLIVWAAAALLFVQQLAFSGYTVDDAFVSFRYARNLVSGLGLVYNAGERVEGYTNFLWTLLMAGGYGLGFDLVPFAKALGVVASLCTLYVLYRLSTLVAGSSSPTWSRTLACLLLAANGAFATAGITGLETSLFALLVTAGAYFYVRGQLSRAAEGQATPRWQPQAGDLSAVCFALGAMTRPEGTLVFGFGLVMLLAGGPRRSALLTGLRWMGVYAAIYLPYYVWRLSYYGYPFPNTYYAKTGAGVGQYLKGLIDLGAFSSTYYAFLFLLALAFFVRRGAALWTVYVVGLTTFFAAVTVYEGGDWIPFFRMVVPVLPLYYLVLQEGLVQARLALRAWAPQSRPLPAWVWRLWRRERLIAWTVVAGLVLYTLAPSVGMYVKLRRDAAGYQMAHAQLARWLKENARGPVALMDIGLIGYVSGLPIVDTSGLTDTYIAHAPGGLIDKRFDFAYILSRNPEFIVLTSTSDFVELGGAPTDFPIDRRIDEEPEFKEDYQHLTTLDAGWRENGKGYFLTVFERRQ